MADLSFAKILELSVSERLQLAQDIWDSVASEPASLPVTIKQKEELDRRLGAHRLDPGSAVTWAETKRRLWDRE